MKDLAWGEFESVNVLKNGKTVKKRKCNHCSNLVSNKIERIRAHLGKCDQYKLIGQGEGCIDDDDDVEMATGFSPAPAVPVGQSRLTTPYRSRSPVPVEPRSVSPATSIRTPTPTPSPSGPSAASMLGTIVTKQVKIDSFVISTPLN